MNVIETAIKEIYTDTDGIRKCPTQRRIGSGSPVGLHDEIMRQLGGMLNTDRKIVYGEFVDMYV